MEIFYDGIILWLKKGGAIILFGAYRE